MLFDVAAYDRHGDLSLLLEVKRRLATSPEWAIQLRRNILAHGRLPATRLFAVAVPDRIYLWDAKDVPQAPPEEVDARPIFGPYFSRIGTGANEVEPEAFAQIVTWWLQDLAEGEKETPDASLLPPRLVDAVRGGEVRREIAA